MYLRVDPKTLSKDFGELLAHIDGSRDGPAVHEIPPTPGGVFPLLLQKANGESYGGTLLRGRNKRP